MYFMLFYLLFSFYYFIILLVGESRKDGIVGLRLENDIFWNVINVFKIREKSILVNGNNSFDCTNVTKTINNVVHQSYNWSKLNSCLCHSHFVHFKENGTYNLVSFVIKKINVNTNYSVIVYKSIHLILSIV